MKLNVRRKISNVTRTASHFVLDQTQSVIKISQNTIRQLNLYFKSDAYEEDLDEAITLLHLHNESAKPDYDNIKNRRDRVMKKTKFVKDQAILFVKMAGVLGGEIGAKFSGAKGAVEGVVIGTATGVVIITVVAGHIVYKRVSKGNDSSFSVDAVALDGFIPLK
jgi:hypothetical protein